LDESDHVLEEIHQLREKELITKRLLVILIVSSSIGALSLLVPYIYSIVPVYESE